MMRAALASTRSLGLALGLALAAPPAARADTVTLDAVLERARTGPAADAGAAAVSAAGARIAGARAARLPRIGAELRAGAAPGSIVKLPDSDVYVSGSSTIEDAELQGRYGLSLVVDQTLYDFGLTGARIDAATRRRDAARAEADDGARAREDAAADAFFAWSSAVATATVAAEELAAADADVARASGLLADGRGSPADVATAEAVRARARLAAARADGTAAEARAALEAVIGELPAGSAPDPLTPTASSGTGVGSAAHLAADAARGEARAAARAHRPSLAATLTLGARGVDDRLFPAWEGYVVLRAPLWDRSIDAAAAEARARARQLEAEAQVEDGRRAAEGRAAGSAVASARQRDTLAAAVVEQAEAAVARAAARAEAGSDDPAERARAAAELRRARLERTLTSIDLAAAQFRAARHSR